MIKRKYIVLPVLLCMLFSMPAQAAESTYKTEVQNNIKLGQVAIELKEYELDTNGKEVPYQNDKKDILPGQKISKIVRITNNGNDAWIRVKVEYSSNDGIKGLSDDNIVLSGDKWERHGDYYYYKEPVKKDASIDFMKEVVFPVEWGNDYVEKHLSINISADAVQTDNFTPDFTSDDPWFGTLIEERVYEPFTNENTSSDKFSVEFRNGADGLVRIGDDFFHNFGTALPGDTLTDYVTIGNNYHRQVHIYFNTETIDPDNEFLKKLKLTIKNGSTVIFDDTMEKAIGEDKKIDLGEYKDGDSSKLEFTIYVPKELTNKFALAETKTKWIFTASLKKYTYNKTGGGGSDTPTTPETTKSPKNDIVIIEPTPETPEITTTTWKPPVSFPGLPKTGDMNVYLLGGAFIILAGGAIFMLNKGNKEGDEDGKKKH